MLIDHTQGEGKRILATYTGPEAPLACVAVSPKTDGKGATIYAGSWDKTIWTWDAATKTPGHRFRAHADFVKALLLVSLQGTPLLISGSADATIIIWDAASGVKLHTLKGHTRGVLDLALDTATYDPAGGEVVFFSAGSDREIRRWVVTPTSAREDKAEGYPMLPHETSVDALVFDSDGDLWSASADKTVKCLSRSRAWEEDTSLEHPDYARDVVVDEVGGWIVTACRDEEVRVWERGSGKLHHVFEGHFEEVTALVLLGGQRVVSVSIDGTVRVWVLKAQDLAKAIKEAEEEREGKVEEVVEEEKKEGVMTAEEEEELAALMEDSE